MTWWMKLVLIGAMATPVAAQEPTTRPADPERPRFSERDRGMDRPIDRPGERGRGMRPRGPGDGPANLGTPASPEEIEQALEYMKDNFPRRFEMFEKLPDKGPLRERMTNMMVDRWRRAMHLQANQPEIYEQILQEQKLADEAFGLARDVREGKEGAREQLRAKVFEIIEQSLADRRERIERLEKQVQEQKAKLDEDERRIEAMIEKRMDELEKESAEMAQRIRERREMRDEGKTPE